MKLGKVLQYAEALLRHDQHLTAKVWDCPRRRDFGSGAGNKGLPFWYVNPIQHLGHFLVSLWTTVFRLP